MSYIHWVEQEGVATITIDSPPVNALNQLVLIELEQALDRVTSTCRVLIITGAGQKAFVAGADIREFPPLGRKSGEELALRGQRIFKRIEDLEQPVIAAIDGFALGGGLELALACDFRIATQQSLFGLPEVKLGIIPGYGGTQRLARLIGLGKAKQLTYSGEPISAAEAYRLGLIEELVERDALLAARHWAQIIASRAPLAVQATKKAINQGVEGTLTLQESIQLEATLFGEICTTADKQEGVQAFLEKRDVIFLGQ